MSLSRRIHLQQVFLVIVVAGMASYAAAMPQETVADPTLPRVVATPQSATAIATERQSLAQLNSLLLSEATGGGPLTEPVLVVPRKPMDPQAVGQAVEDLSVMSRIIEKNALGEYYTLAGFEEMNLLNAYRVSPWNPMGPVTFFPAVGRAKPMYLGGYGAVFFIQVSYPLLPPPQTPPEQPANQQEDPVWAEAKRSVLEPQARPMLPQEAGKPVEPYSREQVDTLRNALISTLKHATNIRVLEPGEWLTIVVQGVAPAPQMPQGSSPAPTRRPPSSCVPRNPTWTHWPQANCPPSNSLPRFRPSGPASSRKPRSQPRLSHRPQARADLDYDRGRHIARSACLGGIVMRSLAMASLKCGATIGKLALADATRSLML